MTYTTRSGEPTPPRPGPTPLLEQIAAEVRAMSPACDHGHIRFERGGVALCADCGADITERERRATHWRAIFDRSHPYEVSGPDGPVAQFSEEEWRGDRVCRCAGIIASCALCQGDELSGHSPEPRIAWHRAGHPGKRSAQIGGRP